jgi:hypothetical protein
MGQLVGWKLRGEIMDEHSVVKALLAAASLPVHDDELPGLADAYQLLLAAADGLYTVTTVAQWEPPAAVETGTEPVQSELEAPR